MKPFVSVTIQSSKLFLIKFDTFLELVGVMNLNLFSLVRLIVKGESVNLRLKEDKRKQQQQTKIEREREINAGLHFGQSYNKLLRTWYDDTL